MKTQTWNVQGLDRETMSHLAWLQRELGLGSHRELLEHIARHRRQIAGLGVE